MKRRFWVLAALFAAGLLLNLSVEDALARMGPAGDDGRWQLQILLGLWDMFEGLAVLLILVQATPVVRKLTSNRFVQDPLRSAYLGSFFAEYLRMLGQILAWGLLLLIPGFIRYCQLIFVPLVALFSSEYRKGEVDALELSSRLARPRLGMLISVLFFTIILQLAFELLPHVAPQLQAIESRTLFSLASFLINVWTYSFIFLVFEQSMEST